MWGYLLEPPTKAILRIVRGQRLRISDLRMNFSIPQLRAARALLDWSQRDLARAAGVSLSTVADFENGKRRPLPESRDAIRRAIEGAGVMFLARGRDGEGVRMRREHTTERGDGH